MKRTISRLAKFGLVLLPGLVASPAAAQWFQGPSGGKGGNEFNVWNDSHNARDISFVGGVATDTVQCFSVVYRDSPVNTGSGQSNLFSYGGSCEGGAASLSFNHGFGLTLDPDEYILGVDGTFDDHISSIRFFTNKRQTPIFGSSGSRSFGYTAPSGQMIVAFIGRAGTNLDAIGVMYAPCPSATKQCK